MQDKIPMIDLFAGAGGLSLGFSEAGFELVDAVELDADACKSLASIHGGAEPESRPIEEVRFRDVRGQLALLAGGPPCQPFSSGGKRLGNDDPRNGFPEFLRAVSEAQPDMVLVENVPGLLSQSRRHYFTYLLRSLRARRYRVSWAVLSAADFGVPQRRSRLFVVGSRLGRFEFPPPTHGSSASSPHVPSGSVLDSKKVAGEPNPSIVTYARKPDLRPSPYDGLLFNGGGRAIKLDAPAPTILASAGGNKTPFLDTLGIVPEYHAHLLAGGVPRAGVVKGARRITVAEAAALQTFPERAKFSGGRSKQYTLVGNAVPPRLAKAVASQMADHFQRSAS